MREASAIPDPVELVRGLFEAANRRDFDGIMGFYASDAVIDGTTTADHFEGRAAIRSFLEDFAQAFESLEIEQEEILDLGGGVVFVVNRFTGLHTGSRVELQMRDAHIYEWVNGTIVRVTLDTDTDRARASAERLAAERR
jgi:ketosteroid isomerase-like protein